MEKILEKHNISKELHEKVFGFLMLQDELGMLNGEENLIDITTEILVMASEGEKQPNTESKCNIQNVSNNEVAVCGWCGNKLDDAQKFNNTCFNCGKSPYSKQTDC